jgi:hypothetical protein
VVFGGGDSAFDALEELHTLTESLSLVHRRTTFTAMKNKEKILVTINTILYRLGNKYKPDEKIYIQDDHDSLFCDEVIQDLEQEGCFSIRSSSKDIFYEDQFRNTEYEKWLESINTLKLFEYKRKLL